MSEKERPRRAQRPRRARLEAPVSGAAGAASERIALAHGGGGQLTDELLESLVLPRLDGGPLAGLLDSALLDPVLLDLAVPGARLAFTIDAYVVWPWRFPGGDIGRLAVSGTVNDLAVCGARPAALALALVLTEGLPQEDLAAVVDSIAAAGAEAGVRVVTGDTKVVGRGQGDGLHVVTAGVGVVPPGRAVGPQRARPGDVVLVSGPVGDHGLAVLLAREGLALRSALRSDVAPLNRMLERLWAACGEDVVFLRDPTRAGLAGVLCDLARHGGWRVAIEEAAVPVRPEARHAADLLGLDPLEVANEGKVVVVVRPPAAVAALETLRADPLGREAAIIGSVEDARDGICELRTEVGGRRILQKPHGEQLPRIC